MDLQKFYNYSYKKQAKSSPIAPSESLVEFLDLIREKYLEEGSPPLKTLEIGAGTGGLIPYFLKHGFWLTCLDFSQTALDIAKEHHASKFIDFICADISSYRSEEEFEFVFDSHLIHCLTDGEHRLNAFKNIYFSLKPDGLFALSLIHI